MTTVTPSAGRAEMLLISDFPVEAEHLRLVGQLIGEHTAQDDIQFGPERRTCRWPLRVPYESGTVTSLSFHLFLCSSWLSMRREVVRQIHALGCNLELCFHVTGLDERLSIPWAVLKQLADLEVQLSFVRAAWAER